MKKKQKGLTVFDNAAQQSLLWGSASSSAFSQRNGRADFFLFRPRSYDTASSHPPAPCPSGPEGIIHCLSLKSRGEAGTVSRVLPTAQLHPRGAGTRTRPPAGERRDRDTCSPCRAGTCKWKYVGREGEKDTDSTIKVFIGFLMGLKEKKIVAGGEEGGDGEECFGFVLPTVMVRNIICNIRK